VRVPGARRSDDPLYVARRVKRQARRRDVRHAVVGWLRSRVLPVLGSLIALGLASVAAFTIGVTVGLFVTAFLVAVVEWRLRG